MAYLRGVSLISLCRLGAAHSLPVSVLPDNPAYNDAKLSGCHACGYATKTARNFYDVLEITPKATNTQIKSAYYRLSKKFHPDVNKSMEAESKFAELSTAYEILGNKKNRRMYDRGFLNPTSHASGHAASAEDMDYHDFIKNRGRYGQRRQAPTGKTDTFDFDEFYRQHYDDAMRKSQEGMEEQQRKEQELRDYQEKRRASFSVYAGLLIVLYIGCRTLIGR